MNKAILIGRLTKDPDVRTLAGGNNTVASFTLAIDRTFKNKDGEKEADFIPCVLWNKTAEIAGKFLHKGDQCCVVGRIQTRNYDDKDGKKVYVTEIVGEELQLLGGKKDAQQAPEQPKHCSFPIGEEVPF